MNWIIHNTRSWAFGYLKPSKKLREQEEIQNLLDITDNRNLTIGEFLQLDPLIKKTFKQYFSKLK